MRQFSRNAFCLLPVAAALAGCAYQEPLSLPPLGAPGVQRSAPYSGYGAYDPYFSVYGSQRYGYYDPRYGYVYGGRYDPRYAYPPGYAYYSAPGLPYPIPGYAPYPRGPYCIDANRDGRCDERQHHKGDGRGDDGRNHQGGGGHASAGGSAYDLVREVDRQTRANAATGAPSGTVTQPPAARRQAPPRQAAPVTRPAAPAVPPPQPARPATPTARPGHDEDATPARRGPRDEALPAQSQRL
ncbi:MAG: hypothetical protein ACR2I8_04395 [Steroidobacteraceae bacterium]